MAKDLTSDLTDKQIFFCREYLKDLNGTQAAIRAGYSEDSAKEIASENLTKPNVRDYIEDLKAKRSARLEITADKVLSELAKIGFSDIRKFYGPDGQLKSLHDIDDDAAASISSLKSYEERLQSTDQEGEQIVQGTNREVKMHDKLKALELISKHIGFFEKDNEQVANAILKAPVKIEIVKPRED